MSPQSKDSKPISYLQEDRDLREHETSRKSPRVFVIQETALNLVPATKFGQLVALLPSRLNITMSPVPVLRELKSKLKDFRDQDYLLPLGDPIAIGLAFLAAIEANRGKVQVLKWNKRDNAYYVVNCNLHERGI